MANTENPKRSLKRNTPSSQDHFRTIKNAIRGAIRQVWSRYSEARREALYNAKTTKPRKNINGKLSKRPNVAYTCAICQNEFKSTEVEVDHLIPVGKTPEFPPDNSNDWNEWILRLFCSVDNLRVLCKPCHRIKSNIDRARLKDFK